MRKLMTLMLAASCLLLTAPLEAGEFRQEGNVWLPQTIKKGEILPVLIVHEMNVDPSLVDLEHLASTHRVAVVHARYGDALSAEERGFDVEVQCALGDAAQAYPAVAESPWILATFGSEASALTYHTLRSGRVDLQGVVVLQPTITRAIKADAEPLPSRDGTRALLLETAPNQRSTTKALVADLQKAGVQATGEQLHRGGSLPKSAARRIGRFLEGFAARRIADRSLVPPAARMGTYDTVVTKGADDLLLTADLYRAADPKAPVVILFHQARSSRGEYRRIAPRLVAAGYNVLALDQRSGDTWADVDNQSAKQAKEKGLAQDYIDARPDLDRALTWVRELKLEGKIAIVGSSYSSSLAIFVGADSEDVAAVVSFSPGDYLPPKGSILEAAARLKAPTLVVCPPKEEAQAKAVFDPIAAKGKKLYVQPYGVHGASTLYRSKTLGEAWKVFLGFLQGHVK